MWFQIQYGQRTSWCAFASRDFLVIIFYRAGPPTRARCMDRPRDRDRPAEHLARVEGKASPWSGANRDQGTTTAPDRPSRYEPTGQAAHVRSGHHSPGPPNLPRWARCQRGTHQQSRPSRWCRRRRAMRRRIMLHLCRYQPPESASRASRLRRTCRASPQRCAGRAPVPLASPAAAVAVLSTRRTDLSRQTDPCS